MKRKGFTIVELLMVVGILSVLITIVTTAAAGAVKQARARKADALVAMVNSGIATYYAQKDEWPDFESEGRTGDYEMSGGSTDTDRYVLTDSECDKVMRELIKTSVGTAGNPLIDITGLFVARSGVVNSQTVGMDFMVALRGDKKKSPRKMKVSEMMFGYPDSDTGRFRRFKMVYSIPTDQLTVTK